MSLGKLWCSLVVLVVAAAACQQGQLDRVDLVVKNAAQEQISTDPECAAPRISEQKPPKRHFRYARERCRNQARSRHKFRKQQGAGASVGEERFSFSNARIGLKRQFAQ